MQISYNIDDLGILRIYLNNQIHAKICNCDNMTDDEINKLINEVLMELTNGH